MDLLDTNKHGMSADGIVEDDDWNTGSDRVAAGIRGSHQTDLLQTTTNTGNGRYPYDESRVSSFEPSDSFGKMEDVYQRAIDDFMRSPKPNPAARSSMSQSQSKAQQPKPSISGGLTGNGQGNNSFRKTGVCVSKSY